MRMSKGKAEAQRYENVRLSKFSLLAIKPGRVGTCRRDFGFAAKHSRHVPARNKVWGIGRVGKMPVNIVSESNTVAAFCPPYPAKVKT